MATILTPLKLEKEGSVSPCPRNYSELDYNRISSTLNTWHDIKGRHGKRVNNYGKGLNTIAPRCEPSAYSYTVLLCQVVDSIHSKSGHGIKTNATEEISMQNPAALVVIMFWSYASLANN